MIWPATSIPPCYKTKQRHLMAGGVCRYMCHLMCDLCGGAPPCPCCGAFQLYLALASSSYRARRPRRAAYVAEMRAWAREGARGAAGVARAGPAGLLGEREWRARGRAARDERSCFVRGPRVYNFATVSLVGFAFDE
jgi:hypothetical protein